MRDAITLSILFIALSFLLASCTVEVREDNFFQGHGRQGLLERRLSDTVSIKDLAIKTADNTALAGILAQNSKSRDFLIYFCGVGENISDDYKRITLIAEKYNINVVAFDYRGYGLSGGKPGFDTILTDALVIYDYTDKTFKPKRIYALGHSIGTTCTENIGLYRKPAGIILEAAFTNASEAIPGLPGGFVWPANELLKFKASEELAKRHPQPEDVIKQIKVPLLILHGANDPTFPVAMARKMYENAGSKDKKVVIVNGSNHFVDYNSDEAGAALRAFLK